MENNIILLETFDDLFAAKNIRDNEALAYLVKITRMRKKVGLP